MNMNAPRTVVLKLHRFVGLTAGLVLVFTALTGILIAYRPKLEPIVNRELLTVPACGARVPLDVLLRNARAAHPAGDLDYIRVTAGEVGAARMPAVQVRIAVRGAEGVRPTQDDLYFNPCDGRYLGQRERYDGVLATIEKLHRWRFVQGGNVVTGTCALLLVATAIGGLYMWWPPGRRTLRSAATFDPRLKGRDRHRVVGLYVAAIVTSSALTGLPQAFDWYRDGIYKLTGSPLPPKHPKSRVVPGVPRLAMEAYWRRARELDPDPAEALLHIPSNPADPVEIFMVARDAPHVNARTMLFLDAYTSEVLYRKPYAESSLGHKLYFWTLSWHMGQVGGVFGPLIVMTGALGLLYLAWTGIGGYWRRRLATSPTAGARHDGDDPSLNGR